MIKDLVLKNRSYRKYYRNKYISISTLKELVELARNTPSSKNMQPLKYLLVNNDEDVDFVFKQLKWAWYLKDWNGPVYEEQPPSYIIMCIDTNLNENALIDAGIAAQTILLGATEKNLGGCILRTVNRYVLSKYFEIPSNIDIIQVLAIGIPKQKIEIVGIDESGSIEYFENNEGTHFVPKRSLNDIILNG